MSNSSICRNRSAFSSSSVMSRLTQDCVGSSSNELARQGHPKGGPSPRLISIGLLDELETKHVLPPLAPGCGAEIVHVFGSICIIIGSFLNQVFLI